jgi:hypothetical protein
VELMAIVVRKIFVIEGGVKSLQDNHTCEWRRCTAARHGGVRADRVHPAASAGSLHA